MEGVASQVFAGYRALEQKHARSLKQDGVSCTADYIVIERASVAHRLILFVGSDVGGGSDARGRGEICAQFFGRKDPLISAANSGSFAAHEGSESDVRT